MQWSDKETLFLDFETYFDTDYTLRKMTTTEYLRDPRFRITGLAVRIGAGSSAYFRGEDVGVVVARLQERFGNDLERVFVISHNAMFDMAILSWKLGVTPRYIGDTLSLARIMLGRVIDGKLASLLGYFHLAPKLSMPGQDAPFEEWARYARQDVDGCAELYGKLVGALTKILPPETLDREMGLIDWTIRAYVEPQLEIDPEKVNEVIAWEEEQRSRALAQVHVTAKELGSADKFAAVLKDLGVEVEYKEGKKGQVPAVAKTDKFMMGLLEHGSEVIRAVAEARLITKSTLLRTRSARLAAHTQYGSYPVPYRYFAAHTGRWGGAEKENPQNLPREKKGVPCLRRAIRAPEGRIVISGDLAQIEPRLLAHISAQTDLEEGFRKGEDIYSDFASYAFGCEVSKKVNPDLRQLGKKIILGCGYGAGAAKVFSIMQVDPDLRDSRERGLVTEERVKMLVRAYRERYVHIPNLWRHYDRVLEDMMYGRDGVDGFISWGKGFIRLPDGMLLLYPNLQVRNGSVYCKSGSDWVSLWGGVLTENIVQAAARSILVDQMTMAIKRSYRPAMTTHDEFSIVVEGSEAEKAVQELHGIMTVPPKWAPALPLATEIIFGREYQK